MSSSSFIPTILSSPSSSSVPPAPPPPPTPEESAKLDELVAHFQHDSFLLPVAQEKIVDGDEKTGLSEDEKMFLSREGLLRFLVATKLDLPATIKRLEACLLWRRSAGIDDLEAMAKQVENENKHTGGQFVLGYSMHQQPVIVMIPSRRQIPPSENGLMHLFFLFERAIDLMPPHVSKVIFLIDFGGKSKYSTPLGLAKMWIDVLQSCYPERLGLGMMVNIPWMISIFLNAAVLFMDPVTKAKLSLNPTIETISSSIIPKDQLLSTYGGDLEGFELEDWAKDESLHDRYWSELLKQTKQRRESYRTTWREMGGTVGLEETKWKEAWKEDC